MVRVHETSTFRSWGYRVAIARIGSIRPRDLRVPLFLVTVSVLCLFWIKAWAGVPTDQLRGSVEDLLERAYVLKIEKYSGEKVTYLGDTVDGDLATVKTKFTTKQGTEIPVDYRLLRRGDRWLVYDVFVEGVSLVANYRTQFDRIMRTGSYDELVRRMKASQSDFNSAPGKSPTPRS